MRKELLTLIIGCLISVGLSAQLVITEFSYNNPGTDFFEFIEIQNTGTAEVDMTGYTVTGAVDYTFDVFSLAAGEYVVLSLDEVGFMVNFNVPSFQWSGALNNSGETITLSDANAVLVDEVTYDDGETWPLFADSYGSSMVLCDVASDNSDPSNWQLCTTGTGVTFGAEEIYANPGADSDCNAGPIVSFLDSELMIAENEGEVSLTVIINNPGMSATTVDVAVSTESTVSASDYTIQTSTLSFAAGESTAQTAILNIVDDTDMEGTELLVLELSNVNNNGVILKDKVAITISDNDAAVSNSLILTGIFDAQPGSTGAKGLELFAVDDIADLSIFALGVVNNGGGSDGIEYNFPAESAAAGEFIYITEESLKFEDYFGFSPNYVNSIFNMNGDDAIELYESGQVIDVFGDIQNDGTGSDWEYLDGWAYRVSGTGPDSDTFVLENWVFGGVDALNGGTENNNAPKPFPIGLYSTMPATEVIANDEFPAFEVEYNTAIDINVLANDITPNPITEMTIAGNPTSGIATVNGDNTINYSPNTDYCGEDSFEYSLCDAFSCDTATVFLEVSCPPTYPRYTIGEVSMNNTQGVPDSLDVTCELEGLVYGVNLGAEGVNFALIDDNNDGIIVFEEEKDFGYTVNEGDQIVVRGTIDLFNGLTEIIPDTLYTVSPTLTLKEPTVVTFLNESVESQLVSIENVSFVNESQWGGGTSGFNVDVTDGTRMFEVRIDSEVDLFNLPIPGSAGSSFNITGIVGQYDTSSPFDDGYQLLPRNVDDFTIVTATQDLELAAKIEISPNPVKDQLNIRSAVNIDQVLVMDLNGKEIIRLDSPGKSFELHTSRLVNGTYVIKFLSEENSWSEKITKF